MQQVSRDIAIYLFSFLPISDFLALLKTCTRFAKLAREDEGVIYRNFFKRDFTKYIQPYDEECYREWCEKFHPVLQREHHQKVRNKAERLKDIMAHEMPVEVMEKLKNLAHANWNIPWKEVYTRLYGTAQHVKQIMRDHAYLTPQVLKRSGPDSVSYTTPKPCVYPKPGDILMCTIQKVDGRYSIHPEPFFQTSSSNGFHGVDGVVMTSKEFALFHKVLALDSKQNYIVYKGRTKADMRAIEWLEKETVLCIHEGVVCKIRIKKKQGESGKEQEKEKFCLVFPFHAIGHLLLDLKRQVQHEFSTQYAKVNELLSESPVLECKIVGPSNAAIQFNSAAIWPAILQHIAQCELVVDPGFSPVVISSADGMICVTLGCKRQPTWLLNAQHCYYIQKKQASNKNIKYIFCTRQKENGTSYCKQHFMDDGPFARNAHRGYHNEVLREQLWYSERPNVKLDQAMVTSRAYDVTSGKAVEFQVVITTKK